VSEQNLDLQRLVQHDDFPLANKFNARWALENEMGPSALWLTESLGQVMDLKPGMRVLDLGCGMAMSSIFLARELGVQVWATDLWISATDNWKRICEMGLEDRVYPVHAEARALPYADQFFDAIVSLDSYHYFGTDVHYLEFHLLKLLKPGGQIGIVSPASPQTVPHPLPDHLDQEWHFMRSVEWWNDLWTRCPGLDVEHCEPLPGGFDLWLRWSEIKQTAGVNNCPGQEEAEELATLRADAGRYLGLVRMVARKHSA